MEREENSMKKSACIVTLAASIASLAVATGSVRAADKGSQSSKAQPITLTGCLNGPDDDGSFKLRTSAETVLIGAPVDVLRENSGKEVRVTGGWIPTGQGKAGASAREGTNSTERALKADKIETIAAECQTGS